MHGTPSTQPTASAQSKATRIDLLTSAAIAIVTYLVSVIVHEALGHGLATLLVGVPPIRLTSVDLEWNEKLVQVWQLRVVAAAGSVGNLVTALIGMALLRWLRNLSVPTRYFLWLLTTNNLLIPGGYMMVLTLAGIGDWDAFVQGLPAVLVWRIGITLVGIIISLLGLFWGARNLDPFLGQERSQRVHRSWTLILTSYLVGSTVDTLAGVLNPTSPILILISAAASSFGGTAFLLWIPWIVSKSQATAPDPPLTPRRDWLWIGLGMAALVVYFVGLGPGLPR